MIIRDSSLYRNKNYSDITKIDGEIRIGVIKSAEYESETDTFFYMVEINRATMTYLLKCRQMAKFGDVYNFEEWGFRGSSSSGLTPKPFTYQRRVGEVVIVAHIGGNPYDGVILGTLKHPSRRSKLKPNTLEYLSEFNGLRTHIDESGGYKVIFQGTPLTSDALKYSQAGGQIPQPQYNTANAGSYISIDNTGSLSLNDDGFMPQYVKIDKTNGRISITSGSVFVDLYRNDSKIDIYSVDMQVKASSSFKLNTMKTSIESPLELKIKSAKIAIGFDGVELVDSLIQIIDAIGSLVVSSPVGPCSPVKTAPTWAQIEIIKTKLSTIKGSL